MRNLLITATTKDYLPAKRQKSVCDANTFRCIRKSNEKISNANGNRMFGQITNSKS